ncbi:MAG: hypothetical protein LBC99_04630 [Spirochaetota bacterium]|nr:hypothetical protein [Spirochaetota bacterium]
MKENIFVLDCTLRDGGFAIEDGARYESGIKIFDSDERKELASLLIAANADIVEIGSIELSEDDKRGFAIYQSIEDVSKIIPVSSNCAALFRGPDTPFDDIPYWAEGLCKNVRVIMRYSELQKSIDFCAMLAKKGYNVFVQPMVTMRYTEQEIDLLIKSVNSFGAFALYFVDSYGYMQNSDVEFYFERFDKDLESSVKIGFHAHNNLNLAFSNAMKFIDIAQKAKRGIIIDSTIMGMGQGAGNLQTELFFLHMNKNTTNAAAKPKYNLDAVFDACEIIEKHTEDSLWGYSLCYMLGAACGTAYKLAVDMRKSYNLPYKKIYELLSNIKPEYIHRYTHDTVEKILQENSAII